LSACLSGKARGKRSDPESVPGSAGPKTSRSSRLTYRDLYRCPPALALELTRRTLQRGGRKGTALVMKGLIPQFKTSRRSVSTQGFPTLCQLAVGGGRGEHGCLKEFRRIDLQISRSGLRVVRFGSSVKCEGLLNKT